MALSGIPIHFLTTCTLLRTKTEPTLTNYSLNTDACFCRMPR